jgi:Protein of unknown function (DUF1488)
LAEREAGRNVEIIVTQEALLDRFGESGIDIFNDHRREIERVASAKFDRPDALEVDRVVVIDTAADLKR